MGILVAFFFLFLFLGFPIALILLAISVIGASFFLGINPSIVIQQMFNGLSSFTIIAVPFFMISGGIASRGGTARSLINVMNKLFGRLPGGLGISTIFACAFFAAISGSSLATIVALGTLMIPTLIEHGYPENMSIGIINSAGSLGILIPPSLPMVTLSVSMGLSVSKVFAAGMMPGIFLAIVWSVYVALTCKRKGYPRLPEQTGETKKEEKYGLREFLKDVPALIFPIIILGSIYGGFATPTEAAAISVVYVIIIEVFYYKTTKLSELPAIFGKGVGEATVMNVILGCAAAITWLVTNMQLPALLAQMIQSYIPNKFVFLLIMVVVLTILGCFMEVVAIGVILGPMLMPTMAAFGIDPIHFAILVILCTQIGLISPPFGLNIFVSMRVAGRPMGTIVKASMPYLILLIISVLFLAFVPQITMFLPNLMH